MSSLILHQSRFGVVTWKLDHPARQNIRKVQKYAEKLLRKHRTGACRAGSKKLIFEVEAGIRVLEMISTSRVICTTELHVHRALVACYFAAYFRERPENDTRLIEVIRILAQVAPCLLRPSRPYFSTTIIKRLSPEAGAIYASLAEGVTEGGSLELTLAEALRLFPELSRHGGPRSGSMLAELGVVTEGCRDALDKLGGHS